MSGKILQKYINPKGWIADSEGSGQSEIFEVKFDFVPYVLRAWETEDGGKVYQRAFGVRTEYMSSNSTDPMDPAIIIPVPARLRL